MRQSAAFIGSPAQRMMDSGAPVRHRLDALAEQDHRLLHELAAEGGTDYLLLPLRFSDGSRNVFAVATDVERGFGARDLAHFEQLSHALGAALEAAATHRIAETLLDTYVGHRSGRRILSGADPARRARTSSRRRSGTRTCAISRRCRRNCRAPRLLEMLNAYFETGRAGRDAARRRNPALHGRRDADPVPRGQAGPARGGVRARRWTPRWMRSRSAETLNHRRRLDGCPEIRFGVGLNAGQVVYGNVGAPDRLDFTVIGPAVNRAARLEALTKELGVPLLMTAHLRRRARPAGRARSGRAPDARPRRAGRSVRARDRAPQPGA